MISDVLNDTVCELNHCLTSKVMRERYVGPMREAIVDLKDKATAIRVLLDYPPPLVDALVNRTDEATAYTKHLSKVLSAGELRELNTLLERLRAQQRSAGKPRA